MKKYLFILLILCSVSYFTCEAKQKPTPKQVEQATMKAAKSGNSNAQWILGLNYMKSGDYKNAVVWFKKSAAQNDDMGLLYLGECYYQGKGVAKDVNKAKECWRKSANLGNPMAKMELDKLN